MTREEIKNTPELVDYLLDESVTADSREKLHKRMDEICNLAIQALEQEPILEQIRDEIIQMNSIDYVEPISCEEVLEIIDKYKGDKE